MLNLVSRWVSRNREKCAVFVVGCQRSGTTMLINVLAKSSACGIYGEGKNNAAFDDYRLRSDSTIRKLIENSRGSIIVFKPLLDSQHTEQFLELHPNAKAIWIYRDYLNVASSSVKKWQAGQKDIMCGIAAGTPRHPKHHQYAISEGMSDQNLALVKKLCDPSISAEEGAAMLWYVRNHLYFDLQLQNDSRVLLVRYEDLVTHPQCYFPRIFDFVGCEFSSTYVRDIFDSSAKKAAIAHFSDEMELLCSQMMNRLNHQYSIQHQSSDVSAEKESQANSV